MENLTVIPGNYSLDCSTESLLPMNIYVNNESSENNTVNTEIVQNFIVKHLDGNKIELISCGAPVIQDVGDINGSSIVDEAIINKPIQRNLVLNLDTSSSTDKNGIDASIIRNNEQDSVIQHSSTQPPETSTSYLKPHLLNNEQPFILTSDNINLDLTVFSCLRCPEQFDNLILFRKHLKEHKDKKFNCPKCVTGFNVENNLKIHMITNHIGNSDSCPICEVKFQRKASLKSHVMIHQVEELFLCEECHGEFQNDDELLRHMELHAATKVSDKQLESLVCPYCKLDFENEADYKQHVAMHMKVKRCVLNGKKVRRKRVKEKGKGGYQCKFCVKTFPKLCMLERHERIHTGEKPFQCQFCSMAFAQKNSLQIHLSKHTGLKPYSCTLCPAKFAQKGNLRAHIDKTHTASTDSRMYKCTQCACIFKKVATLNGHITKVHLNQPEKEGESENIIDKVMDSLRELNSELGKSALKRDEPKVSSPRLPQLNMDDMDVVKLAENHVNGSVRRYTVRQKKIGDVRWYFCNCCSARFKKPSDLIRHFRTHTMEKPFKCTKCSQSFSFKTTLINHMKVHEKAANESDYCDTTFKNPRSHNAHVKKAEKFNIPNYICILCEKVFSTLEEGRLHRAAHEGELQSTQNIIEPLLKQPLYQTTYGSLPLKPPKSKVPNIGTESPLERPHQCKICDARFARLITFKRHMLYHSGERKFKCNLCPKAFTTKYRLKEHLNFHKNIKNYGCQTCGKKFVTSSLLKRHTLIHSNMKPYSCPYCDKCFKTVLLGRSHIKNVHQLEAVELIKQKQSVVTNEDGIHSNEVLPTTNPQQTDSNSIILSIPSPNQTEGDLNPEYQMVYLNIGDIPGATSDTLLDGNGLVQSMNLHNDSYLYNSLDLQESTLLLNIDSTKTDMVDPNDVIISEEEARHSAALHQDTSQHFDNVDSLQTDVFVDMAANEEQSENHVTMNFGGLPISFIDTSGQEALTTADLVNDEFIPYDAQVICINCHKMFADYYVFEKHTCLEESSQSGQAQEVLLIPEGANIEDSDKMCESTETIPDKPVEILYDTSEHQTLEISSEKPQFYENRNLIIQPQNIESKVDIDKMKRFTYKKSLLNDVDKLENRYSCKHCNFHTSLLDVFRKHLHYHPDFSDRTCKFCFKEFKKPSDMKRHLRTHTGEKPFECGKCCKKFSLKATLQDHLKTHMLPVAGISCDVCNSNFASKCSLKVHMLLHTGSRPYACNYCDQTFRTSSTRKSHERSIHLNKNGVNKQKADTTKLLKSIAEEVAENVKNETWNEQRNNLEIRPKLEAGTSIIVDPGHTESVTVDPVLLLQQIENGGIIIAPGTDGVVPINLGDITLVDVGTLQLDEIGTDLNSQLNVAISNQMKLDGSHIEPKPQRVECDICHKSYASKDVLRKHKKTVHGQNKKFPCIKCDKGYDQLDELNKHIMKLHTGIRPYNCQYCSNSFSEENSLKTHIKRIHQKSLLGQETANALLGLQYDLSTDDSFL